MFVCVCVCERERVRDRERERWHDMTNSLLTRVMNKHTSTFLRSALFQRGTNLLKIHTANIILHMLKMCTLSNRGIQKKTREKKMREETQNRERERERSGGWETEGGLERERGCVGGGRGGRDRERERGRGERERSWEEK